MASNSRIKFTRTVVDQATCAEGKPQALYFDSEQPGLGLRVTPGGAKSFIFQARLGKQTIRITIGDASMPIRGPARGVEEGGMGAAGEAARLMAMVRQGIDPRDVKRERLEQAKARHEAHQLERARRKVIALEAWEAYCTARSTLGPKERRWSPRHLLDHQKMAKAGGVPHKRNKKRLTEPGILHGLLSQPLVAIDTEAVRTWLDVASATRRTQAALAFRLLRAFMAWCSDSSAYKGIVVEDACSSKQLAKSVPAVQPKRGALVRGELAPWFSAARDESNQVAATYLQCLLLTGARPNELIGLPWTKVDFQRGAITIRDKVDRHTRERTIPLTPYVRHLFQQLPRRGLWVFHSPTSKQGHLSPPARIHARVLERAGLGHLSLHDLRRTFAQIARVLELPDAVAKQMQGHSHRDVHGHFYAQELPLDLMAEEMAKFETRLLAAVCVPRPAQTNAAALQLVNAA